MPAWAVFGIEHDQLNDMMRWLARLDCHGLGIWARVVLETLLATMKTSMSYVNFMFRRLMPSEQVSRIQVALSQTQRKRW